MVNSISKDVFSEVYSFINLIGETYKEKIPAELYKIIEDNRILEYNPIYNTEISLSQQITKKDTWAFIAYLDLNYWCTETEKKDILHKLNEKEKKEEVLKRQLYNPDDLFKKKQDNSIKVNTSNTTLIVIKKENILKKFFYKIKLYFMKK